MVGPHCSRLLWSTTIAFATEEGPIKTFFDSKHYVSHSIDPGKDITQLLDGLEYSAYGLIVDANVPFDASSLPRAAFVERLHGGERSKTISTALGIITRHQHLLDKESLICAIGGGALLDLVGFCCGLMYRGIRYISVPTTVIGMADAAYGGKTAVNLESRNQIGMYHHPQSVYVNPLFLKSLPDLHVRSGIIEIAKLAIFFPDIERALDNISTDFSALSNAIHLAATRKLQLLQQDPFEEGPASVLVCGHAFGNAFETYVRERDGEEVPHGFAVALGILFSWWIGRRLGLVEPGISPDFFLPGSIPQRWLVASRRKAARHCRFFFYATNTQVLELSGYRPYAEVEDTRGYRCAGSRRSMKPGVRT